MKREYEKKNLEGFNILFQIKYSIKFIEFANRKCTFKSFITVKFQILFFKKNINYRLLNKEMLK